VTNTLTNYHLL